MVVVQLYFLEFLLQNNADVSLVNNDNNSALHLACMEVRMACLIQVIMLDGEYN